MILIVVKNPVRPEYADDWEPLMEDFTVATRAEPGNVCFDWYRSVEDPCVYVLVEAFRDREAGEAHVNSAHFQAAITQLGNLLAATPEIVHVADAAEWAGMSEVKIQPDAGV